MATAAQISANQMNANLSSGPKTEVGKAASSSNRLSHGLSHPGAQFLIQKHESEEAFLALLASLILEYQPSGGTEAILVNRLAEHQWLRLRAMRLQETCFDPESGLVVTKNRSLSICATPPPTSAPSIRCSTTC